MYANFVTFLHFFEQLTNSSPMMLNLMRLVVSMLRAMTYSTDSLRSIKAVGSSVKLMPHSSFEQTVYWHMISCCTKFLRSKGLLQVTHCT